MHSTPAKIIALTRKATKWVAIVGLAVILAIGVNGAIASIYSGDKIERAEQILQHSVISGHLTGSGLPLEAKVQVTVMSPKGEMHDIWTAVDDRGLLLLPDLDLVDPAARKLEVRLSVFQQDPLLAPYEFVFQMDKRLGTVDVSGSGLFEGSAVEVFFDDEAQPVSLTQADWSGRFRTGVIGNAPVDRLKGQVCVSLPDVADQNPEICFSQKVSSAGSFTLVSGLGGGFGGGFGGGVGGGSLSSPFSQWTEPSDCEPAGTTLSVCTSGHIDPYWFYMEVINYVRALMKMTQQFTVVMVQQMEIIGAFLDAKHQLEVQRWIQEKAAEAHRDYQPSRQICYYGSFAEDFTGLMRLGEHNARNLNRYFLDREIAPAFPPAGDAPIGAGAPGGPSQDFLTRFHQFRTIYCDPDYNGPTGLDFMCAGTQPTRINNDINYTRLSTISTLNLDFLLLGNTEAETDILAMGKQLFANKLLTRPDRDDIYDEANAIRLEGARALLEARSVFAMRSVIRDSYSQIQAMRGAGRGLSTPFVTAYLEHMNLDSAAILDLIGENPSEMALLNIMMNKMSQNPSFFTETYETEANIERNRLVMQAIDNMGGRKAFESALRREMTLSMRLELRLRELQDDVDSNIQSAIDNMVAN